jgi:hypothetical protein
MKSFIALLFCLTLVLAIVSSNPIGENSLEEDSPTDSSAEDSKSEENSLEQGIDKNSITTKLSFGQYKVILGKLKIQLEIMMV